MGYKIRTIFDGWIEDIEGDSVFVWLTDRVTKEEYYAEMEVSKIEPSSERKYILKGRYFTATVRRRVTIKFYKKLISRGRWWRIQKKVERKWGSIMKR